MARGFPLAGLLRLRHLQQEQAEARLSGAHAILRENAARRSHARSALGQTPSDPSSTAAMAAIAAARASSRSMVTDLNSLAAAQQQRVDEARHDYEDARSRSIGLEKLELRHSIAVTREELHTEQTVIDEIASTAWQRAGEGGAR